MSFESNTLSTADRYSRKMNEDMRAYLATMLSINNLPSFCQRYCNEQQFTYAYVMLNGGKPFYVSKRDSVERIHDTMFSHKIGKNLNV